VAGKDAIMLCLVECGETAWQTENRMHGRTDLPLSEAGRLSVTEDIDRMRTGHVAAVHHPPDEAATSTAHFIARHLHARSKAVEELAEPDLGLLEGLTQDQFEDRFPTRHRQWEDDPASFHPPEGELLNDAAQRIFEAVHRILKRSRSEETVIVLHRLALGMLRCWLANRPMTDLRTMLDGRPRVERYMLTAEMLDELGAAAE
jgi:broad specificity phosphatase PhoE